MKLKERIINKYDEKHFIRRFAEDYFFRTRVFFILSVLATVIMAAFNAATGILYKSPWFGSVAIYFIALTVLRSVLLALYVVLNRKYADNAYVLARKKNEAYLAYGILIVLTVGALFSMLVQMVAANKPIKTGMIIAIANAAYAFTKMGLAIYNLIKAQRINDTLLKVIRNIGIVDSAVSMLALTVTLVTTFGEVSKMRPVLIITAVVVAALTVFIGGYMIVKSIAYLKKRKEKER